MIVTWFHNFRDSFKVKYSVVGKHEWVLQLGHDVRDHLLPQLQRPGDDVHFVLLQVVVLCGQLQQSKTDDVRTWWVQVGGIRFPHRLLLLQLQTYLYWMSFWGWEQCREVWSQMCPHNRPYDSLREIVGGGKEPSRHKHLKVNRI